MLVSSAIIESGLDIPTANTMIINRADTFGLAQLYQLRGRIGRSHYRAYAYLLIPGEHLITPDAQKRLRVLQELDDLGGGFRLAAHDLEIRGAGNLLGKQQSGHITAVGLEMYTHMLEQAVRELRGEPAEAEIEPEVQLGIPAFIPETYIADVSQRLVVYKRMAGIRGMPDLQAISDELVDRLRAAAAAGRHAAQRDGAPALAEGSPDRSRAPPRRGGRCSSSIPRPRSRPNGSSTSFAQAKAASSSPASRWSRCDSPPPTTTAPSPSCARTCGPSGRMIRARAMSRRRGPFVAVALLILSVGAAHAEIKNRIIATVDGEPITALELRRYVKDRNAEAVSEHDALQALITDKLLEREIKTLGIAAHDDEIDRYVAGDPDA